MDATIDNRKKACEELQGYENERRQCDLIPKVELGGNHSLVGAVNVINSKDG